MHSISSTFPRLGKSVLGFSLALAAVLIIGATSSAQPDLQIQSIEYDPKEPTATDEVLVTVTIVNRGTAASDPIDGTSWDAFIQIAPDAGYKDTTAPGYQERLLSIPALEAGETHVETVKVSGATEYYSIRCKALAADFQATITVSKAQPDLQIESIEYTPQEPTATDEVLVTITIVNRGTAASDPIDGTSWDAFIRIAPDAGYKDTTAPGYQERLLSIPALEAGETHVETVKVSGATEYYSIRCKALAADFQATITVSKAQPDLQIESIEYTPQEPTATDEVLVTITIVNRGTAASDPIDGTSWDAFIRIAPDAGYKDTTAPGYQERLLSIPALEAGETHVETVKVSGATEYYSIRCKALAADFQATITVTSNETGKPDLICTAYSMSPEKLVSGGEVTVRATVTNIGNADAASSLVMLQFMGLPGGVNVVTVPALTPGASHAVSSTFPVADEYDHYEGDVFPVSANAILNFGGIVTDEACAANNEVMWSTSVYKTGKPDLICTAYSMSPEKLVSGGEVTVHATVANIGNADAASSLVMLQFMGLPGGVNVVTVPALTPGASHAVSSTFPVADEYDHYEGDVFPVSANAILNFGGIVTDEACAANNEVMWSTSVYKNTEPEDKEVTCPEERIITRGDSTAPTQDQLDWAAGLGLAYADTPKPDGATGDAIEWIERVWSNATQSCIQTIAMIEPPLDCPRDRIVQCDESTDPTSEELEWAGRLGLTYWDDGPKPLPEGQCGQDWVARWWGESPESDNACSQAIDIMYPTPEIVCPQDVTVSGCPGNASTIDPSVTGTATFPDPCAVAVALEYQDEHWEALGPEPGVIHRVWRVSDRCGETSRCDQTIHWISPYPYLSRSLGGTLAESNIVFELSHVHPQPPIFEEGRGESILIVGYASNSSAPPEEGDPVADTAVVTVLVDGNPAGGTTLSVLPGEEGIRFEMRVPIPSTVGCHEVTVAMESGSVSGCVFVRPAAEDPDF